MIVRLFVALSLMLATVVPGFANEPKTITPEPQKKGFILIPLIVGAIIGATWFNNRGQKCYRQVVTHDDAGKPVVKTICETEQGPVVID